MLIKYYFPFVLVNDLVILLLGLLSHIVICFSDGCQAYENNEEIKLKMQKEASESDDLQSASTNKVCLGLIIHKCNLFCFP